MTAMNNPIFISDEGLRNGYGNTHAYPGGGHVYPGYSTNQGTANQRRVPGAEYTSLNGQVNRGYRGQEEPETMYSREQDNLSHDDQYFPSRENAVNDHLTLTYNEAPERRGRGAEEQKDKRNSALRLGVPVFPMTDQPPKYNDVQPYYLPRNQRRATQV